MDFPRQLGFIGGGRMAEALIKGILAAELIPGAAIQVADPSDERRQLLQERYGVGVHAEGEPVWRQCPVVILAVKPQLVVEVLAQGRLLLTAEHLLISIAAGIPLALIEQAVAGSGCRLIRVMPNTPAMVLEGAAAVSPGANASQEDLDVARTVFEAVGVSVVLDESLLDAVTGLSGSGPAYVFTFVEALIDAGVRVGLARPVARTLAIQTVLGSLRLALAEDQPLAELRAMVTSPGGTTIAGLHALEKGAFRGLIMDAVVAATQRSQELGRELSLKD